MHGPPLLYRSDVHVGRCVQRATDRLTGQGPFDAFPTRMQPGSPTGKPTSLVHHHLPAGRLIDGTCDEVHQLGPFAPRPAADTGPQTGVG